MSTRHPRMRHVLLAGFAPFDGAAGNPSWDAARVLDGEEIAGHRVVARRLPVEFGVARDALRRAILEVRPALVLCTGLASGRDKISLERVAINVDDARIPDNAGRQPVDLAVVRGGPAAYFSTLPIKAMYAAIREAGIPAEVSQSAGTYVCNHVFYGMMHMLRRRRIRAGFVHVPPAIDNAAAGTPGALPLESIVEALRIALRVALSTPHDRRIGAGATE
ncbi:pyroglutamyl-peptidase I [Luteimonas kalidii]|uniref:Pyrrolidone-carboxylate peptidase n=1 Tax=Luteimonas kalidii TaxID=3042025 RepID=A0ABT6JU92_9GAMM|nr:pyroglutamyl-peptidase I [Luteimonas kalidii]MDH5834045.1 pyroglutamyl-peptidase I [Luteimonas kalidii]